MLSTADPILALLLRLRVKLQAPDQPQECRLRPSLSKSSRILSQLRHPVPRLRLTYAPTRV